jgi:hypothetical protein
MLVFFRTLFILLQNKYAYNQKMDMFATSCPPF